MTNIRLEDDCEVSWEDSKTRLKVAAETFGFPFFITLDEVAYAYKSRGDYMAERADGEDLDEDEMEAIREWWDVYANLVTDYESGLRTIYPWFHDGETE